MNVKLTMIVQDQKLVLHKNVLTLVLPPFVVQTLNAKCKLMRPFVSAHMVCKGIRLFPVKRLAAPPMMIVVTMKSVTISKEEQANVNVSHFALETHVPNLLYAKQLVIRKFVSVHLPIKGMDSAHVMNVSLRPFESCIFFS